MRSSEKAGTSAIDATLKLTSIKTRAHMLLLLSDQSAPLRPTMARVETNVDAYSTQTCPTCH